MRRVILAVALTITGLVLLLSYRTPGPTTSAGSQPGVEPTGPGTTTSTGQAMNTPYGPVQVEVSLSHGTIVDVRALQVPDANSRDVQISNFAIPRLRQETLDAQSADIDVVSGASYTSEGDINSLQSALDQAAQQP